MHSDGQVRPVVARTLAAVRPCEASVFADEATAVAWLGRPLEWCRWLVYQSGAMIEQFHRPGTFRSDGGATQPVVAGAPVMKPR